MYSYTVALSPGSIPNYAVCSIVANISVHNSIGVRCFDIGGGGGGGGGLSHYLLHFIYHLIEPGD